MACFTSGLVAGQHSCPDNHAWHSSRGGYNRATNMVAVSRDWIFSWLDLVVLYDRALAKIGAQSWRPSGPAPKVGCCVWVDLAEGLGLRKNGRPKRRLTFSAAGNRTNRWTRSREACF